MAPPNPKYPSRGRAPVSATPRRRPPTVELPFDDDEVLRADDPRPQRVPQYPATRAAPRRRDEEVIPTTVYEISQDEELPPRYDAKDLSDSGYKPAYLYVEKGPGAGQLIPVRQGSLVIGRASISELRLQHPSVSRRHAQVTRLGERFYLKDLGSQNATYVNKVRIETEIEIYPGDQLQVGNATLKLRGASEKVATEVRRQLDKAAVVSAKRAKKATRVEETERRLRPQAASHNIRIALACTAIGFGLAILGFVAVKVVLQDGGPTARPAPGALPAPVAALPAQPSAQDPQIAVEAEPVRVAAASPRDEVQERIDREMAARAARESARAAEAAEPAPAVQPERPRRERPRSSASQVARRERVRRTHRPAPAREEKRAAPSNAEILRLYEDGNVGAAIASAREAGDMDLAQKLSDFKEAYAAGTSAERAGNGTRAIKAYQKALAVDEKISGGWGKHGPAISKKLGHLYVLVGQYYQGEDDRKNAELAFKAAVRYDPQNQVAKKHLASLDNAPRKVVTRRAEAIDEAWGDEEAAPKKVSTREKRASAIEAAWDD